MTFAIAVCNGDQIIQVSDRRLTAPNGKLVDDSSNKAGHALCVDASFLYCFTGLAQVRNRHTTSRWLLDALYDAAQTSHRYYDVIARFTGIATDFFNQSQFLRGVSAPARRLTVMFSGYMADGHIVSSLVSNYLDFENGLELPEAGPDFRFLNMTSIEPACENPTLIRAIGQCGALMDEDNHVLMGMLKRRAPAEAIRQRTITLIQEISERPQSGGTVGKKVNTARLRYTDPRWPVSGSDSDVPERVLHLVDQVNLLPGAPKVLVSDIQLSTDAPVFVPRPHRNAPCPCGSGVKYRLCHGKHQPTT